MKKLSILSALVAPLAASPAFAASGPFFSLGNTDFVVLIATLAGLELFGLNGFIVGPSFNDNNFAHVTK